MSPANRKSKKSKKRKLHDDEEENDEEDLFLIKFMKAKSVGRVFYNILWFIPVPLILWIMDGIFKGRIQIWFCYTEVNRAEDASHVLLYKTTEKKTEIIPVLKERLYLGNKGTKDFLTIHFNYQRFVYEKNSQTFVSLHKTFIADHQSDFVRKYRFGLKNSDSEFLRETWGGNLLAIEKLSTWDVIYRDNTSVMGMWTIIGYLFIWVDLGAFSYYGILMILFWIDGTVSSIQNNYEVHKKMKLIVQSNSSVIVVRENDDLTFTKKIVNINELVPGDLIEIIANMPVPADCVLVNGECVMQESMLTGESVPILKAAYEVDDYDQNDLPPISSKNMLLAGSEVLYTKGSLTDSMLAVVVATGYYTQKGTLVQKMIHPEFKIFPFYTQAFETLLVMMVFSSVTSIFYFYYRFVYNVDERLPPTLYRTFMQMSNLYFICSKPTIPLTIFASLNCSVGRLKGKKVTVVNKMYLAEAAWVDTVCFDKTGTLTEDEMIMHGFLTTSKKVETQKVTEEEAARILDDLRDKLNLQAKRSIRMKAMMSKMGHEEGTIRTQKNNADQIKHVEKFKQAKNLTKEEALKVVRTLINLSFVKKKEREFREYMIKTKMEQKAAQLKQGKRLSTNFDPLAKKVDSQIAGDPNYAMFLQCFGICNTLVKIGKKMVGDPLEVEMFRYSSFTMSFLQEARVVEPEVKIKRKNIKLHKYYVPSESSHSALGDRLFKQVEIFDFSNSTRRMSVVSVKYLNPERLLQEILEKGTVTIKDLGDLDHISVLCKGAPETVGMLCNPESIPSDFDLKNNEMSSKGLKVLGLASRIFKADIFSKSKFASEGGMQTEFTAEDLPELQDLLDLRDEAVTDFVKKTDRLDMETDMEFLGLYLMENPLKDNAKAVVSSLKSQNVLSKIITGDNLFTAMNVAQQVSIIGSNSPVYVAEKSDHTRDQVSWVQMEAIFDDSIDSPEVIHYSISEMRHNFLDLVEQEEGEGNKFKEDDSYNGSLEDFSIGSIDVKPEMIVQKTVDKVVENELDTPLHQDDNQDNQSQHTVSSLNLSEDNYNMNLRDSNLRLNEIEPNMVMTGDQFDSLVMDSLKLPNINFLNEFKTVQKFLKEHVPNKKTIADMTYFAYAVKVFGRCNSLQKTRIINFVKYFKSDKERTLAFVGDGSNDLQAIKSADFSLKLGHSELSGSTPFVSDNSDLSSILVMINEAKCNLMNGYCNFSIIIFYIIMDFITYYTLIMNGLTITTSQSLSFDFGMLCLFAYTLPTTKPRNRLSIHSPSKTLFNRETNIFLIGQIISGTIFIFYGYKMLTYSDFYRKPIEIAGEDEYRSSGMSAGDHKFFDNHYFFLMTCFFSLTFLAVDNGKDNYREGFFATAFRSVTYVIYLTIFFILLTLPIVGVQGNIVLTWIVYAYRIPMIFSEAHPIVNFMILFSPVIGFAIVSIILKTISVFLGTSRQKRQTFFKNSRELLFKKIQQ